MVFDVIQVRIVPAAAALHGPLIKRLQLAQRADRLRGVLRTGLPSTSFVILYVHRELLPAEAIIDTISHRGHSRCS